LAVPTRAAGINGNDLIASISGEAIPHSNGEVGELA
jgi:hypothetical protein